MREQLRWVGTVVLLAGAGGVVASACVRNDASIFVRGCMAVPRDTCLVTPSANVVMRSGGSIDSLVASEYVCAALVENQMVQRGNANQLRVETSRVSLYRADVTVLDASNTALNSFFVPLAGFVDPSDGTNPGYGWATVIMLDADTVRALTDAAVRTGKTQTVTASVVVHGRTLGGIELETNEFLYPVDVGRGWQCVNPSGGGGCYNNPDKPTDDCWLGLDGAADCRLVNPCSLECTTLGDLSTARCPTSTTVSASMTCCP